eukprot:gene34024-biopygen4051
MAAATGNVALWTEPRMKVQLQKLRKSSDLGARTRVATWQKQRDQIMAWVAEHVSELQEVPAAVEDLTEELIEAELFTVDVAGALTPGPWTVSAGTWAARKDIEAERFSAVAEWARAILALRMPTPTTAAPAHAFEPLVFVLPELRAEECELDELPPGAEATLEHWRAFVHLLQARVGEIQRFVKSQRPTVPISDVMAASFFRKRKRVTFEGEEEEVRAAGGGHGALPPLDAARRDRLATLGAGFRTVDEEQLARALRGELAPEDVVRPPGGGPPLTAVPSRGPLAGIDLVVSPVQRLLQEDEGRLKLKDGELTMVAKKKKCKDFAEWGRVFLCILCEAPAEARDDLMDFVEWARTIAAEFSFYHFNEFYEHLVRQVQRSATGISLDGYDRVWRVYTQTTGLKEKGVKKPRDRYSWRRDAEEQPRPTVPGDAGGGKGKGKGAGGRGGRGGRGGGRGGRGGNSDACYGHNEGNRLIPAVAVPLGEPRSSSEAPVGAERVPVTAPDPMVEADAELEFGQPIAVEDIGAVDAHVGCGPPDVEDGGDVPLVSPGGADTSGRWWADLREDEFIPVWDVLGGPCRHTRVPMAWEVERRAPLPVTQMSPGAWASALEPGRTRCSTRWPQLRADIVLMATIEAMEACGTSENERRCYEEECLRVGFAVPTLTSRAHLVAAAFRGWHDVDFLVRCAACGAGWPSEEIDLDVPYRVPNYVGPEHMDVMREEIRRESTDGHIFLAGWRLPLGVIALGMVEKVRKGKVKYRPVSDYSRPVDVGVNARIQLEHEEFTTVKEAYGMMRPGYWMVKVDLESAYRSLGIASQFWPHQCFEFDGVKWMDARAPFGNRALPGIFMRWTRAIVAWMRAQGIPTVGYLDDFFCVLETREQAEEAMMLLVEFVTFLGFKVNSAKCEGPAQIMEFLGVLLDTSGAVCTASIDEERIAVVVQKAGDLRTQAARGMVARRRLESLLGLLAFCSHVVWGLSLYTRRGFNFLAATTGRRMVRLPRPVLDDLAVLEQVVRRYNGRRVLLERRLVDQRHFATDASGTLGFGGHDIRLQPVYIGTKDNLLVDLLSRLDMPRFLEFGPFTVDSCVAVSRANSYCYHSWSQKEDARVQRFDGHNAWGNLPFSIMVEIIKNFLRCKRRQQWGTAACFLVPVWDGNDGWELVKSLPGVFKVVRRWEKGTHLFTAPDLRGHGGTAWGPTRWPVVVVRELQREAERYRAEALAPETRRCYGTGPVMPLTLADLAKMAVLISSHDLGQEALWAAILVDEVLDRVEAFTAALQAECYAFNTQCSYSTGVRSFVSFCIAGRRRNFLEEMLPASDEVLAKWVVFMVIDQLVKPSTAKQYTSGVRALHLQLKFEWTPVRERWPVWAALQGCRKRWDTPSKQVMPVGFDELLQMQLMVDPNNFNDLTVFDAMVTAFFFFFRKDNVSIDKADAWNPRGHLCRCDVSFCDSGLVVVIRVRHSKTIQAGERSTVHQIDKVFDLALQWEQEDLLEAEKDDDLGEDDVEEEEAEEEEPGEHDSPLKRKRATPRATPSRQPTGKILSKITQAPFHVLTLARRV